MRRVIALGFFDGVHLGHQALLKRTVEAARELSALPTACTFDIPPASLVTHRAVPLLTTPEDRAALMEEHWGIAQVIIAPFDQAMRTLPWDRYVTDYLVAGHDACHLVCGQDHRFGYHGEGTADKLQALCADLGLGCDIIPPVEVDGAAVSSTRIRRHLAAGEVDTARRLLGRPYALTGPVAHGKSLGHTLGFPTVNLTPDPRLALPKNGVYAGIAHLGGGAGKPAVTNIGVRPTVDDGEAVTVEAFLLDFEGDLYGQTVTLDLRHFLRPERKFASLEALRAQIQADAQMARRYFSD